MELLQLIMSIVGYRIGLEAGKSSNRPSSQSIVLYSFSLPSCMNHSSVSSETIALSEGSNHECRECYGRQ